MIDRLIAQVANATGLPVGRAREVTGRILAQAEASLGAARLEEISAGVPGTGALLAAVADGGHGLAQLDPTLGLAATGRFGGAAGVAWVAQETGIPEPAAEAAARQVIAFFTKEAGAAAGQELADAIFPPTLEDPEDEDDAGDGRN